MKKAFLIFLIFYSIAHAQLPPVYVVLFTHIEDNTPVGTLGTPESRQNYLMIRGKLIAMANLAQSYNIKWVFQPDWKILLAALMYEDSILIQSTDGKNFLKYLRENLNVTIDPHSHEKLGYNYTDVAHLLDSLDVGATTVIGGHVWDPTLPQFQNWDRFRVPVYGLRFPWAIWRGDILMGSGTPNHVNDPKISGVWRPKDKFNYFVDDSTGNIYCIGQYKGDIVSIPELINLYKTGFIPPQFMLTTHYHITPTAITSTNGLKIIEDSVLKPMDSLRTIGEVKLTDFTELINDWKNIFKSKAFIYDSNNPVKVEKDNFQPADFELSQNYPNPFNSITRIRIKLNSSGFCKLKIFNILGNELKTVINEYKKAGEYVITLEADDLTSGIYFYNLNFINGSSQRINSVTKLMTLIK